MYRKWKKRNSYSTTNTSQHCGESLWIACPVSTSLKRPITVRAGEVVACKESSDNCDILMDCFVFGDERLDGPRTGYLRCCNSFKGSSENDDVLTYS